MAGVSDTAPAARGNAAVPDPTHNTGTTKPFQKIKKKLKKTKAHRTAPENLHILKFMFPRSSQRTPILLTISEINIKIYTNVYHYITFN